MLLKTFAKELLHHSERTLERCASYSSRLSFLASSPANVVRTTVPGMDGLSVPPTLLILMSFTATGLVAVACYFCRDSRFVGERLEGDEGHLADLAGQPADWRMDVVKSKALPKSPPGSSRKSAPKSPTKSPVHSPATAASLLRGSPATIARVVRDKRISKRSRLEGVQVPGSAEDMVILLRGQNASMAMSEKETGAAEVQRREEGPEEGEQMEKREGRRTWPAGDDHDVESKGAEQAASATHARLSGMHAGADCSPFSARPRAPAHANYVYDKRPAPIETASWPRGVNVDSGRPLEPPSGGGGIVTWSDRPPSKPRVLANAGLRGAAAARQGEFAGRPPSTKDGWA